MGVKEKQAGCGRRWLTLAASIGFCLMYPMSFTVAGLFLIHLGPHFGVGNKAITWIAAFQSGIGGSCGVIAGYLVNRFGASRVGVVATLFAVAGLLIGSFAENIYILYASFGVVFGLGSSTFVLVGFTAAFKAFPDHRPLVSGTLASFISVGGFIWAPLIEMLIQHFSWKGALMIMAGIHLHGFTLSMLLHVPPVSVIVSTEQEESNTSKLNGVTSEPSERVLNEKELRNGHINASTPEKSKMLRVIEEPGDFEEDIDDMGSYRCWKLTTLTMLLGTTLMIACHMNFNTYIPKLNQQNGFSKQQGAFLISVIHITSAIVRLPAGMIGNLKFSSCTLLYGLAVTSGAALSVSSLLCHSYTDMIILCVFYGIAGGVYMSLQCAALIENVPQKYIEVTLGMEVTLGGISIFILHGTAGFILDAVGDTNILFFIFGSAGLLGGLLILTLFITKYLYGRCSKEQENDRQKVPNL